MPYSENIAGTVHTEYEYYSCYAYSCNQYIHFNALIKIQFITIIQTPTYFRHRGAILGEL